MNIFLAVVEAYNPATPGTETLYFASKGFNTSPTDVPASQHFDGLLLQPSAMRRDMFSAGTTMGRSRSSVGDVVLANPNGELDYLLDYSFDGRAITVYYGAETATYPSGFGTVVKGSVEQMELGRERLTLKLRDRQFEVDVPLQTTLYAGDNALPAGLEGVATDLKGKPKPWLKGVVKNIAPPLVNSSKLIYQVSDGAVDSVDGVWDSGIQLHINPNELEAVASVPASTDVSVVLYDPSTGLFVTLSTDSGTITLSNSTDGDTFTARDTSTFTSSAGAGAIDPDGLIVLVNSAGELAISSDGGATWAAQTSGFGSDGIRDVCYGPGYFVAVGGSGSGDTSKSNAAATTWTLTASAATSDLQRVAYGNGTFVAINATEIITATDGATWSAGTKPTSGNMRSIAFGAGIFVLSSSTGEVFTSIDGAYWTERYSPITKHFNSMDFFPNIGWVGVESGGYMLRAPADAITWTRETVPGFISATTCRHTAASPTVFIVGSHASPYLFKSVGVAEYASQADLLDDSKAPQVGSVKAYSAEGFFRLGSPAVGLITADVTEGAAAGDRTAGQVWTDALIKLGKTSVDWSAADVTALDSDNSSVIGYYSDTDEVKGSDVLDQIAGSIGAWWGVDRSGIFRIQRLEDPQDGTSSHTFIASDMVSPLTRLPARDADRGIPTYRNIVKHTKYYAVQKDGLAGGVSDVRRGDLAKEWREETSTDTTVQTAHKLAPVNVVETLLTTAANASTEAARLQTLRGVRRDRYEFTVALDATTVTLDLGSVVTIIHPRFGLAAGGKFTIISVDPDSAKRLITFGVWGSATVFARWPYVGTTETFTRADTGTYMFDPEPHSVAPAGVATVTLTMGTV